MQEYQPKQATDYRGQFSDRESSNNALLQDKNFLNYINQARFPLQSSSLTPNPKLFQQNKVISKRQADSRQGENFAGLQAYIISEIDSGSDKKGATAQNYLSDASSFSNSSSSES